MEWVHHSLCSWGRLSGCRRHGGTWAGPAPPHRGWAWLRNHLAPPPKPESGVATTPRWRHDLSVTWHEAELIIVCQCHCSAVYYCTSIMLCIASSPGLLQCSYSQFFNVKSWKTTLNKWEWPGKWFSLLSVDCIIIYTAEKPFLVFLRLKEWY